MPRTKNKETILILATGSKLSDDDIVELIHSLAVTSGKFKDFCDNGTITTEQALEGVRDAEKAAIKKLRANDTGKRDITRLDRIIPKLQEKVKKLEKN